GGNILDECNKASASTLEVHQMLLDGADPRIPDEEDHRNTALHYACRFCHVRIAKMLHKANCEFDQVNDYGLTPLGTLCMFNQPEPRHYSHLRLVQWLLELKADVNHVDKGGHTVLEFAAAHGNVDLVAMLLKFGARVKRDAQFISIPSVDLLNPEDSGVYDPTCRQLIRAKYNEELRLEEEEKERVRQKRMDEEAIALAEERRLMIEQMHLNKHSAAHEKFMYQQHLEIEQMKKLKRAEAKRRRMKLLEERKNENGTWTKFGKADWQFVEGKKEKGVSIRGGVYDDAVNMTQGLEKAHAYTTMNKRWKELVGKDLLTEKDVTDMGYGVDDKKKEDRDKEEELAKFATPEGSDVDSDEEANKASGFGDRVNETRRKSKVGEDVGGGAGGGGGGGIKLRGEKPKLRRRMSITGSTLKAPQLPKIDG
ncbi:hypothetical protein TeGR_g8980, partial [Tetraparma gracilis]